MTPELGAPVRLLDEDEKERLAAIRTTSEAEWRALLDSGPADPLGALAWLVGVTGPNQADVDEMKVRLDRARDEDFTWRQIAEALGEGDSPEAARRVMDRRRSWG